ncbi:MAG: hypothetical protein EB168_05105 [Euryarchaeota archaeon]|jgi:hypothetical protein|nr:hypothetical protein [Euryarchaeota archaeon]
MATETQYSPRSPYFTTPKVNGYLEVRTDRSIPKLASDRRFEITTKYQLRPDMLAQDLYDDAQLWWVFAQRNPNTLQDPIYDFVVGKKIYIPTLDTLKKALGF